MNLYPNKKVIIVIISMTVLCGCSCFSFLEAEIPFIFDTARVVGLGNAFTAVSDDENAILHNPAGLSQNKKNIITISGFLQNYTWRPNDLFGFNYINDAIGLSYVRDNMGFQVYYKAVGEKINNLNMYNEEIQISTALGFEVFPYTQFGLNAKFNYLDNKVYKLKGAKSAMAFDVSGICNITKSISIGMILHNVISTNFLDYYIQDDYGRVLTVYELPKNIDIGICFRILNGLLFSVDVKNIFEDRVALVVQYDYIPEEPPVYIFKRSYHLGLEMYLSENLSLESGLSFDEQPQGISNEGFFNYRRTTEVSIGSMYKINDSFRINIALSNDFRRILDVKAPFKYLFSTSYIFQ